MESLVLKLGAEVRQRMHNVIGLMDLAAGEPFPESRAQHLSRARECADQLVRTVNDLTELEHAATVARAAPFVVRDALGEIAELMGELAGQKGLTFDWMVYPGVPLIVSADRDLVQDLLHRLIENAIRFTREGGVRLLALAPPAEEPPSLVLEVTDSGPGIPGEVLSALEWPVCNIVAPGLGLRPGSGLRPGLGLRVVRKRVSDLGGRMSISSSADRGTAIRVSMPVCVAGAALNRDEFVARNRAGYLPLRLLIAEDSDDSFFLFQAYTQEAGHEVTRALNGVEAVEMAQRGEHDLIVMDANMPEMDGYTATRLIREWETAQGRARRPILMVSGDDLEKQRRMGGAAGCSGYLSKPADKEQLLRALAYYARPEQTPMRVRSKEERLREERLKLVV